MDAVVPRNPPVWRSVVMGAGTFFRCSAGLCVGSEEPAVDWLDTWRYVVPC